MPRQLGLSLLLVMLAGGCVGQSLEESLASGSPPREVAWAAYKIAQQNRREMIPKLATLVADYRSGEPFDTGKPVPAGVAEIEAVADALIQLQARLDAATVMHLYPQFPSLTIILLSRATHNGAALFQVFQTAQSRALWLAAGNLLALHPSREFVYSLLDKMVIRLVFRVTAGGTSGHSADGGAAPVIISWPTTTRIARGPKRGCTCCRLTPVT